MKFFKTLIAAAVVVASVAPAAAQVYESKSYIKKTTNTTTIDNSYKNYSRLGFYYNNITWYGDTGVGNVGMNGLNLQYVYGISLTKKYPMFLEVGGAFKFGIGEQRGIDFQDFIFEIPVNYSYRFFFNNRKFSVSPFVGLNFDIHLASSFSGYDGSYDLFEYDDTHRFQMGWRLGANLDLRKFYVGLSYGTDFWGVMDGTSSGTFSVGLGFVF